MAHGAQITYANEVARKAIHLTSLLIPVIYLQIDRFSAIVILLSMSTVAIIVDILLQRHQATRSLLMPVLRGMLRPHEQASSTLRLNGASWVLIAAFLSVLLFPKIIAVTAFSILIVSDTFAALIGRKYGRRHFLDKSVIGTVAFVVTGAICVAVYGLLYSLPWTYWVAGFIGAIAGGIAEAASVRLKLDDNISIPMSVSLCMWGIGALATLTSHPDFASFPL